MSLEEKVKDKESKGFIRKSLKLGWKLGMAAATTALSLSTVGMTGIFVGGGLAAGGAIGGLIKKDSLYNIASDALTIYSGVNAVIWPIVALGNATFPLIDNSTLLGKAARTLYATTAYNAAFVASDRAAEHLVDNYMNPKGITKTISDNFYNKWKRVGLGFLPGYALVANEVPTLFGISHFAYNAVPYGIYDKLKPLPEPKKITNSSYMPGYAPAPAH